MLVLSRKVSQKIRINENITVVVVAIQGDKVRLGFDAPKDVAIHRQEVWAQIQKSKAPEVSGSNLPTDAPIIAS